MFLLVHSYLSRVAQADIERILCQKIEEEGSWFGWMEIERLRDLIDDLSTNPERGICRDDIWHGMRSIRHDDYIIYFRQTRSQLGVDILAVGLIVDDPKYGQVPEQPPTEWIDTEAVVKVGV